MSSPWDVTATTAAGGSEVAPAGSHPAVLVALIDLGTHEETFEDKVKGTSRTVDLRKVLMAWELTAEPIAGLKGGRNHVVSRDYNVTFSQKSGLRKMIEGWRGKSFAEGEGFDLGKLLGQKCMVTVKHGTSARGNTFAKFDGVAPVPKGLAVPAPKIKPFAWSVDDGEFPIPDWLPYLYGESVADVIKRCKERNGNVVGLNQCAVNEAEAATAEREQPDDNDTIPF